MKPLVQIFSKWLSSAIQRLAALLLIVSSVAALVSCHTTEANPEKLALPVDSVKFMLAYKEIKQIKVGDASYSFSFDQIKVLFTEGIIGANNEGFTVRTTRVTLGVNNANATLLANGKVDGQGNRQPANWTQLLNAANYVVSAEDLLIGISDVYKDPNKPTYEEPNFFIDVIVKPK